MNWIQTLINREFMVAALLLHSPSTSSSPYPKAMAEGQGFSQTMCYKACTLPHSYSYSKQMAKHRNNLCFSMSGVNIKKLIPAFITRYFIFL